MKGIWKIIACVMVAAMFLIPANAGVTEKLGEKSKPEKTIGLTIAETGDWSIQVGKVKIDWPLSADLIFVVKAMPNLIDTEGETGTITFKCPVDINDDDLAADKWYVKFAVDVEGAHYKKEIGPTKWDPGHTHTTLKINHYIGGGNAKRTAQIRLSAKYWWSAPWDSGSREGSDQASVEILKKEKSSQGTTILDAVVSDDGTHKSKISDYFPFPLWSVMKQPILAPVGNRQIAG